jgi:hypothetical protein
MTRMSSPNMKKGMSDKDMDEKKRKQIKFNENEEVEVERTANNGVS